MNQHIWNFFEYNVIYDQNIDQHNTKFTIHDGFKSIKYIHDIFDELEVIPTFIRFYPHGIAYDFIGKDAFTGKIIDDNPLFLILLVSKSRFLSKHFNLAFDDAKELYDVIPLHLSDFSSDIETEANFFVSVPESIHQFDPFSFILSESSISV